MTDQKVLSDFYKLLAEQYLRESFSIKRLEERFEECDTPFVPKVTDSPARFLSLVNEPHLDRLSEEELQLLDKMYEGTATGEEAALFLEKSCPLVLAGDLDPGVEYEFFRDFRGRGIFPGNTIVFRFRDKVALDGNGKLDEPAERKKSRIFANVKRQFEEMVGEKAGAPIRLVRIA